MAGDAGRALTLAEDLDEAHLKGWGQTGTLTSWLVRLAGELTDPYDRVRNAALLARALAQQDDLGPAIAMTRTALDLNDALEIREVQLRLLVQMAGYYFDGGHVGAAAEWYEEVLDLAQDGDPMVAEAHLGVAICRAETGDLSGALDALDEAAAAGSPEPLTGARIGFARATVACERDEYRRCRDLLQDARAAADDQNAYVLAGRCDDLSARIEWLRNDFDEAQASAQRARDAGERTGHPGLSRAARVTLATLFLAHDPVRALEEATAATRFDRSPLVAEAFAVRGVALVRTDAGDDLAVEAFAEADRLASGLLARESGRYLIREVQGLARAGLALLRRGSSEVPAERAYRKAIPHPDVPGAWHRRRALFRALVAGRPGALPRLHDLLDGWPPAQSQP
ncbi:hypothetical protein [Actinoplanes aureus]|uniref:Tetratricopeptide repeat protein n=1 Tax=Actinoplanes aureus TaxID=2792083 RepID=A0A931CL76_9ACTN|nr:hypothetical protein [Actinoplanes aureus]MBG0568451.1 hypothetical protein [Actinoplanes aureus]